MEGEEGTVMLLCGVDGCSFSASPVQGRAVAYGPRGIKDGDNQLSPRCLWMGSCEQGAFSQVNRC